ncbi:MAG: response regulator transcription factor [Anaerolineaceae bacterium]|nr:response regulator transcription factor [Anaerolineaceae bacterium]
MITVMLVDDHAIVRGGVAAYLSAQKDIEVVGEAASGEEAVELAAQLAPDVILMDLLMPHMDGVEATWRVRRVSPRSQVIVLTSYHEDTHIFPAIKAGALSYLLKDIEPQELAEAIRSAARGEATVHPKVASRMMAELRGDHEPIINSFSELTEREQEVLRRIADGMSNADIAARLVISEKTVKSHVSNILSKLHLSDRTQAAVFAWREGIVRKDD